MIFSSDKAIYLQICDRLMDEILAQQYKEEERIPSVREYATNLQVNTNTAMKAYDELSRQGVIFNKRGMGYFVSPGARSTILGWRKQEFIEETVPQLLRQMHLMGMSVDELINELRKKENP